MAATCIFGSMNDATFLALADQLSALHTQAQHAALRQVNYWLTARNWLVGFYLAEYEQHGQDRATYGEGVLAELAKALRTRGVSGLSLTNLKLCRQFYQTYPSLLLAQAATLQAAGLSFPAIGQTVSDQSNPAADLAGVGLPLLLTRLSFSHFIELLSLSTPLQRAFYEVQAVKNNWSVRELKRAIDSALYERTGLSTDKAAVLAAHSGAQPLQVTDVVRNPYVLEFLGLEQRASYSESELEQAIIDHLQTFLLELGRGFCFEARQKRLTFDNEHYYVDLVFYHRLLKCHVLVDLKLGAFSHADAGQMNVYLNYFREQEMSEGDNPPVGLILCAQKNETLVRYATAGLSEQLFVSKYQINLPSEAELQQLLREDQERLRS
jgi:predicted nuclease of restriction endonuclease-like (RecB) superfamily